jgi:hypothetical protein
VARAGRDPSRNPRTFVYFCFESCAPGQSRLLAFNNLLHTRNLTQVDGVCRHSLAPTIHIRFRNYPFPPRAHNLSMRATRATSALRLVLSLPTIESSTGWVLLACLLVALSLVCCTFAIRGRLGRMVLLRDFVQASARPSHSPPTNAKNARETPLSSAATVNFCLQCMRPHVLLPMQGVCKRTSSNKKASIIRCAAKIAYPKHTDIMG